VQECIPIAPYRIYITVLRHIAIAESDESVSEIAFSVLFFVTFLFFLVFCKKLTKLMLDFASNLKYNPRYLRMMVYDTEV
jgi:hypothetical protein